MSTLVLSSLSLKPFVCIDGRTILVILCFLSLITPMGECRESALPDILYVQIPAQTEVLNENDKSLFSLSMRYMDGCQIKARLAEDGKTINLTPEFVSAKDPSVSFDGQYILFAGKKNTTDNWQIWQMNRDGSQKKQLTNEPDDCVSPLYVGSIFHLNDAEPTDQIIFAGASHGWVNEIGTGKAFSLYVCDIDGSHVRRITYNLSTDFEPDVLPNGRVVYSSWQRHGVRGVGCFELLEISIDGTDLMPFTSKSENGLHREMVRFAENGKIYFIESESLSGLGGGRLACVSYRRPMHTYERLDQLKDGLYHSPCPLPSKDTQHRLFVSFRENQPHSAYKIYIYEDSLKPLVSQTDWHCIDAQVLAPHTRAKGRSTVVDERFTVGEYFCMDVYASNRPEIEALPHGCIKRLRVIEGLPIRIDQNRVDLSNLIEKTPIGSNQFSATTYGPRRILGDVPIESDGSFHIQIPAEIPVTFQLLDEHGMALAKQDSWTWIMRRETRGCTGCHEDPELSPPNKLVDAVLKPGIRLTLQPGQRRTVNFKHDIAPIIEKSCSSAECHVDGGAIPFLDTSSLVEHQSKGAFFSQAYETLLKPIEIDGREQERYVYPGSARNSPLVWHLFGKRMGEASIDIPYSSPSALMPPEKALDPIERRLIIEWIDLGAQWDSHTVSKNLAERQTEKIEGRELW